MAEERTFVRSNDPLVVRSSNVLAQLVFDERLISQNVVQVRERLESMFSSTDTSTASATSPDVDESTSASSI
jgi:hypothetical protein